MGLGGLGYQMVMMLSHATLWPIGSRCLMDFSNSSLSFHPSQPRQGGDKTATSRGSKARRFDVHVLSTSRFFPGYDIGLIVGAIQTTKPIKLAQ